MITSASATLSYKNGKGRTSDRTGGGGSGAFWTNTLTMMIDVAKTTIKQTKTL